MSILQSPSNAQANAQQFFIQLLRLLLSVFSFSFGLLIIFREKASHRKSLIRKKRKEEFARNAQKPIFTHQHAVITEIKGLFQRSKKVKKPKRRVGRLGFCHPGRMPFIRGGGPWA